jgi:hypothetical protein
MADEKQANFNTGNVCEKKCVYLTGSNTVNKSPIINTLYLLWCLVIETNFNCLIKIYWRDFNGWYR